MIGLESYKTDAKKQSRRQIAEELFKRVRPISTATVLYLPGPVNGSDWQRKSLMSVGFKNENIIGVDLGENVQAVRKLGGYCVKGKLEDVINSWPQSTPIDVILADLCCGFDKTVLALLLAIGCLVNRQRRGVTVYINMQRGRDAYSNEARAYVQKYMPSVVGAAPKEHRGLMVSAHLQDAYIRERCDRHESVRNWINSGFAEEVCQQVKDVFSPMLFTYRNTSRSVFMDAVLFNWPKFYRFADPVEVNSELRMRIIATLATASRRRNAL